MDAMVHGREIKNNEDRTAALNGLIRLVDVLSTDELKEILSLPQVSFDIIIAQYILKSLSELQQTLPEDSFSEVYKF